MKKAFTTFLFLTGLACTAVGQTNFYHYVIDANAAGVTPAQIRASTITADGGTVIVTDATYLVPQGYGIAIIKFDNAGNKLWEKFLSGFPTGNVQTQKVMERSNGDFVLGGQYSITGIGTTGFLLTTNATGDAPSFKHIGGTYFNVENDPSDNGLVVAGTSSSATLGGAGCYLLKTDAAGDPIWALRLNYTDNNDNYYSAKRLADGTYLAVGQQISTPSAIYSDGVVAKFSAAGALLWTKSYSTGDFYDAFTDFTEMPDQSILISAVHNTFMVGSAAMLYRIDADGNLIWSKEYGQGMNTVFAFANGAVYGAGIVTTPVTFSQRPFLMKFNEDGNLLWSRLFKPAQYSTAMGTSIGMDAVLALQVRDGRVGFNAYHTAYNLDTAVQLFGCYASDTSFAMLSVSPAITDVNPVTEIATFAPPASTVASATLTNYSKGDGCELINGVQNTASVTRVEIYPNPTSESITIFRSGTASAAAYTITDPCGRLMTHGILHSKTSHVHLSSLAAGMYVITIDNNDKQRVKVVKN